MRDSEFANLMGEKDLITACLEDPKENFRKIVDVYKAQVMAAAMNILGNREDAEDASQETFIQVFRNLERFDFKKSFKS
jgi:RNA polymerase sigma-70 factor (ECF subfamily)